MGRDPALPQGGQGGRRVAWSPLPPTRVQEPSSCPDGVLLVFTSCFSPTAYTAHPVTGGRGVRFSDATGRALCSVSQHAAGPKAEVAGVEASLGLLPPLPQG